MNLLRAPTPTHPVMVSMRRILEKLWASAQARVASLPNARRLLAQTRAALGMAAGDASGSEEVEVARSGGGQGSRGMREELNKSRLKGVSTETAGGGGGGGGGGAERADGSSEDKIEERTSTQNHHQQQQQQDSHFLETYVFLEEFLKELFSVLSAKSHVERDAHGLSESHRRGSQELRAGLVRGVSVDEGDASPRDVRFGSRGAERGATAAWAEGGGRGDGVEEAELPTSLAEFLREAAFPTFVSPAVL